jgi:succinyl-CoA synthetase beta subunit
METSLQACIDSQHAPRTARPVTVVEINPLALQDEGADAVLRDGLVSCGGQDGELAKDRHVPWRR